MLKGDRNLRDGLCDISIKKASSSHKPASPITNPTIIPTVAPQTVPTIPDNALYTLATITKTNPSLSVIICEK